jgi:hypothetical protein
MTTIAYDGNTLASDSLSCCGFKEQSPARKIYEREKQYIAGSGLVGAIKRWIEWYDDGADHDKFPDLKDDLGGIFIVDKETKLLQVWGAGYPYPVVDWNLKPNALGSGEQFAMGALLAGANAEQAVIIASKLDTGTNDQVQVIVL